MINYLHIWSEIPIFLKIGKYIIYMKYKYISYCELTFCSENSQSPIFFFFRRYIILMMIAIIINITAKGEELCSLTNDTSVVE